MKKGQQEGRRKEKKEGWQEEGKEEYEGGSKEGGKEGKKKMRTEEIMRGVGEKKEEREWGRIEEIMEWWRAGR